MEVGVGAAKTHISLPHPSTQHSTRRAEIPTIVGVHKRVARERGERDGLAANVDRRAGHRLRPGAHLRRRAARCRRPTTHARQRRATVRRARDPRVKRAQLPTTTAHTESSVANVFIVSCLRRFRIRKQVGSTRGAGVVAGGAAALHRVPHPLLCPPRAPASSAAAPNRTRTRQTHTHMHTHTPCSSTLRIPRPASPSALPNVETSNPGTRAAREERPHRRVRSRTRSRRTSEPVQGDLDAREAPLQRAVRPRCERETDGAYSERLECTRARYSAGGSPPSSSTYLSRRTCRRHSAARRAYLYRPRGIQRRKKRLRQSVRLNRSPRSKTDRCDSRRASYGILGQEPGENPVR